MLQAGQGNVDSTGLSMDVVLLGASRLRYLSRRSKDVVRPLLISHPCLHATVFAEVRRVGSVRSGRQADCGAGLLADRDGDSISGYRGKQKTA